MEFIILVGLIILIIYGNSQERKNNMKNSKNSKGERCCPFCGSTNITANKRGFAVTTGFIGSQKVRTTCFDCGKHWDL